jgi:hypothetical protein
MAISVPENYAAVQMVGYIARGRARSTSPGSSRRGARASYASLLGARLLHLDVGSRRGGDSAVHPASWGGGSPAGSVEIRLIGRPPPRQGSSGRAAAPPSRLDRLALASPGAGCGSSRISARFRVMLDQGQRPRGRLHRPGVAALSCSSRGEGRSKRRQRGATWARES